MNYRTLGAITGLVVSAGVIGFILTKLYDAGQPAPTAVQLVNSSSAPISVEAVDLGMADGAGEQVLRGPFALAASAPAPASKELRLPVGRPVAVAARIGGAAATCRLDPRPLGQCVVNVVYGGPGALRCEYDCKPPDAPR